MTKFIFFGTGGLLSSICLSELIQNGFIPKQVILQAQASCIYPNLTELCALSAQIPVKHVEDVNSPENVEFINSIGADFGIIASFGQIFKKEVLSCFPIYNVHMGVLPEYRGAYTNFWKILANHNKFGATIHLIDELIDGGKAVLIVEEDYSDIVFANTFFRKNYEMAAKGLIVVMQHLKQGNVKYWNIDVSNGKYYPKHSDEDLILDPEEDVRLLHVKINRLQFYGSPIISGFTISESNLLLVSKNNNIKNTIHQITDNSCILQNKTGVLLLKKSNIKKN
jgi:methionyl-tRNA formyltransferase